MFGAGQFLERISLLTVSYAARMQLNVPWPILSQDACFGFRSYCRVVLLFPFREIQRI